MVVKEETLENYQISKVFVKMMINIMWMVQFSILIVYRYAHTGKVCSGDFKKYNLEGDTDKRD